MIELEKFKPEFEKIIEHLNNDLASLRTSRATPALVENIMVEAYGGVQPLKALASLTTPDPKTLIIEPWDKSIIKEIEKAILASKSGLNPVNEGNILRIVLPPMTEETRQELVKLVGSKVEVSRGALRSLREKIKNLILESERKKEISQDMRYRLQEKLEELVSQYNKKIEELEERKKKEILTI